MERQFRLAARASATAIIADGQAIEVPYVFDGVPIKLTFRTRYLERGHAIRVPGDLWLDAVGAAQDLASAAAIFTNGGRLMASLLSVGANAAVGSLEPEVVYESTPGLVAREHFQRYVPPDDFAFTSRFMNIRASTSLISAIAASPSRHRLVRAASQYSEALTHCRTGCEVLCVAHLFMSAEALKVAAWRHVCRKSGVTKEELAAEWGFKVGGRMTIDAYLEQEARLKFVFDGDVECHKQARMVSDAFEHGFEDAPKLYKPAGECLLSTAAHVRRAIMAVADLATDEMQTLLSAPFARPRGPAGIDSYVRSKMVSSADTLAAPGVEYPHYAWRPSIKNVAFDSTAGRYTFQREDSLAAVTGDGVAFTDISYEGWDKSIFSKAK